MRLIVAFGSVLFASSCAQHHSSAPISLVVPAPGKPYLILTADRTDVQKGDSVEVIVTFVNPTKRRLMLPSGGYPMNDEYALIDHHIEGTWNGGPAGFFGSSIDCCPPSAQYLEPGQQKTYRLKWKADRHYGEGVLELKYKFGWNKDFPPVTLKLMTH
jgi:hypothetical protein